MEDLEARGLASCLPTRLAEAAPRYVHRCVHNLLNTAMDFSCRVHLRNNGDMPYVSMGPSAYCSVVMLSLAISHSALLVYTCFVNREV